MPTARTTAIPDDVIRLEAYYLWEQSGRPHGRDLEFWNRAAAAVSAAADPRAAKPRAAAKRAGAAKPGAAAKPAAKATPTRVRAKAPA